MKQCFYSLLQPPTLFFIFFLSGCKNGGDDPQTTPNIPPPTAQYQLTIAPANEQIIAIALDTKMGVDLTPYIKSEGLINLRIEKTLTVKKVLGKEKTEKAQKQCRLATGNALTIAIEFSTPAACVLQYQVKGETFTGEEITEQGEITLIGSQKPEFAVLPPLSLILIKPKSSAPYHIDLDAFPAPLLAKKSEIAPQTAFEPEITKNSHVDNETLSTGNYLFPEGFTLIESYAEGQGVSEANKNNLGNAEINSIKYTAEDLQMGYSHINYLLEKEGVEAQFGQIHISVNTIENQAPAVYDFCQAISLDNTDANGNPFIDIDISPYIYDPDASNSLRLKTLLTHSGEIAQDPNNPLKFKFTATNRDVPYHYVTYLLEDGQGGFDVGQIKIIPDDGLSRISYTMSAGYGFGYLLDENSHLWVTGENTDGNLGIGNTTKSDTWVVPSAIAKNTFSAVSANQGAPISGNNPAEPKRFGYLLDTEGVIWATGDNDFGQLGFGNYDPSTKWKISSACKINNSAVVCPVFTEISAGTYHAYALDINGIIWSTGYDAYGQLGRLNTEQNNSDPYWSHSLCTDKYNSNSSGGNSITCPTFTTVNAGPYHGYAIDTRGELWVIGNNRNGQLGVRDQNDGTGSPTENVPMGNPNNATSTGGKQYKWVKIRTIVDENGRQVNAPQFAQVDAGGGNTTNSFGYALDVEGNLYATGDASNGKLGNAQLSNSANERTNAWSKVTVSRYLPTGVELPILFKEVRVGHEHVYALAKDCGIWGVGSNQYGRLATGSDTPTFSNQWLLPKKKNGDYFSGIKVTELTTGANMGYIKNNGIIWGVGEKNGLGISSNTGENIYLWQELPKIKTPE